MKYIVNIRKITTGQVEIEAESPDAALVMARVRFGIQGETLPESNDPNSLQLSIEKDKTAPASPLERIKLALFFNDYVDVLSALNEIQIQDEKDVAVLEIWHALEDIPMDPDTEEMEEPFLHFPARTDRETIWRWFDINYSKGVHALLYGDDED